MNHASHIRVVGVNDRGRRVGASHPKAKLTQEQVNRIRDLHEDEHLGYRRIARMFGLHRSTVVQICNYTRWQTPISFRKVVVQSETAVKQTIMKTPTVPAPRREIVLLTCTEAARLLRLTTKTVRQWIADGRLNARKTFPGRGGKLLLDRDQVLAAVGFGELASNQYETERGGPLHCKPVAENGKSDG